MAVSYEWDVEKVTAVESAEFEAGEVLDHNHFNTYAEAKEFAATECDEGCKYVVVLVRDDDTKSTRHWAYMDGDKLPTYFEDAFQRQGPKVPQRFHDEVR